MSGRRRLANHDAVVGHLQKHLQSMPNPQAMFRVKHGNRTVYVSSDTKLDVLVERWAHQPSIKHIEVQPILRWRSMIEEAGAAGQLTYREVPSTHEYQITNMRGIPQSHCRLLTEVYEPAPLVALYATIKHRTPAEIEDLRTHSYTYLLHHSFQEKALGWL